MKRLLLTAALMLAATASGASPAQAMTMPACAAAINPTTGSGSCTFDTQYDYALITVVPVGAVTVNIRCVTNYGLITTYTRTVTETSTFQRWTPGGCTLTLTGTAGAGAAVPTTGPIVDPPPPPVTP
jgi:hypothetical protein